MCQIIEKNKTIKELEGPQINLGRSMTQFLGVYISAKFYILVPKHSSGKSSAARRLRKVHAEWQIIQTMASQKNKHLG